MTDPTGTGRPSRSRADPLRPVHTRNRRGEGGQLRQDILTAAVALLDETGDENALTLRAVARRAGISAPSIYPHFADRPTLMLTIVQNAFAELADELENALDTAESDPRRRLRVLCDTYLGYAHTHPQRYRTMFGGQFDPATALKDNTLTHEDIATLATRPLNLFCDTLRDCVTAGHSTSDDPAADAVALWLALHGLAHQRLNTRAFPWPPDITDRLVTPLAHLTPERTENGG